MTGPWWHFGSGLVLAVSCVLGCWFDVRHKLLPNWLTLGTAVAGIVSALLGGFLLDASIHMALALAVGLVLFGARMVGAGDAKYYAALALFFPWQHAALFAACIGIGGIVLLVGWFLRARLASGLSPAERRARLKVPLPFGVAIAIGAALAWFVPRMAGADVI